MFVNSLSAVTATDWTKNLSLHFASGGGCSFIACKRTVYSQHSDIPAYTKWSMPETSTSFPGSILPEFGRTQYLCLRQNVRFGGNVHEGVLLWRGSLDFKSNRTMIGIADSKNLGNFRGEGSLISSVCSVTSDLAQNLAVEYHLATIIAQAVADTTIDRP